MCKRGILCSVGRMRILVMCREIVRLTPGKITVLVVVFQFLPFLHRDLTGDFLLNKCLTLDFVLPSQVRVNPYT